MKYPITQTILLITMTLAAIGTSQAQPHDHRADLNVLPGDLLFFRDTEGMGAAVKESTGQYTHVAMGTAISSKPNP